MAQIQTFIPKKCLWGSGSAGLGFILKKHFTASLKVEVKNWFFCNVQSYITRWLVIRWNLKFKWVFIQIYSSWIIPQKNNLVLEIYDLDDVPLVSKDNLAEEAQKSDLGHHEVFLV